MWHYFTRLSIVFAAAVIALPAATQAETLVTHYFEGDVYYSTSSLVNVGDRLTGTLTYDLDWEDLSPDNPVSFYYFFPPGWALEEFPVGSPIGMSFTVGSLSHRAQEYVELVIDNDYPNYGDSFFFSSDVLVGPSGACCVGAYLELLDSTGTAFSSDRPPGRLDLSAFDQITFWGTDGQQSFLATIDVLRVVPEPATLALLIAGFILCGTARFRRHS